MRFTDKKRDLLLEKIEQSRRDLVEVAGRMRVLVNALTVLDNTMHEVQELARGAETLQEQEPDVSH